MLISAAYATTAAAVPPTVPTSDTLIMNLMMVFTLVILFYFLMIVPQQKRFNKHRAMLGAMKKGDKIVTAGGLVGTIDRIAEEDKEVIIDLGNGIKVTALRDTLQLRTEPVLTPDAGKKAGKK